MSGARGWLGRVLLFMLITQLAVFLVRPVLTYRALDLGADERQVGLLVVAFALLPAAVAIPIGRFSDRRRPGIVILAGAVLAAVACVALYLASDLLALAGGTVMLGTGALCCVVGAQALIARLSAEDHLDRDFGLLAAAASVGQMIGPPVAGLVLSADAGRAVTTARAFALGCALFCVALVVALRLPDRARPNEGGRSEADGAVLERGAAGHGAARILRLPGVLGGILMSMSLLTAIDLLIAYLPLLAEQRGISPSVVGVLLSARAAASVVSRVLIPPMLNWLGRARLLLASTLGTGILLAGLPLVEPIWLMAVVLILAGFFLGIGQPLTMSLVVQAVPAQVRGAALSIRMTGSKIGQVVLPALIAVVAGVFGASSAFLVLGIVLATSAVGTPRRPAS